VPSIPCGRGSFLQKQSNLSIIPFLTKKISTLTVLRINPAPIIYWKNWRGFIEKPLMILIINPTLKITNDPIKPAFNISLAVLTP
jgi:hypothetical protein